MPKLIKWDEKTAKKELSKRYQFSKNSRQKFEKTWENSERIVYSTGNSQVARANYSFQSDIELGLEDIDNSTADLSIVYAFKNLRFLHAQLSANPPSVITRPASSDQDDRRKADAADRLIRHAIRNYKMQERIDKASLNCLLYGTTFMKVVWDSEAGDVLSVDEEGNMEMEGDLSITIPSTWNILIDPDAECWEDVRYVFERKLIPFEEALFRFPDKKELLEAHRIQSTGGGDNEYSDIGVTSGITAPKFDVVELFEYWEKGAPVNGYLGRFCVHTRTGDLLTPVRPNPYRFKPSDDREARYDRAELPYHIFTDVDLPNNIWGKSFLEYVTPLQDLLNRLDTVMLDNVQAHGVARLILNEGSEIMDDSITNSPWDIIKITGSMPPHFMQPMPLPPALTEIRERIKIGIDDMAGVNEAMFGQQSRETSGFSMQYATNQGNMIRRRLFNKYVMFVESIYKGYLKIIQKHWKTNKTIQILGKEKALETVDIRGADIDGGFDLVVEYGQSLSLDPMTRREEILSLQPIFEKAGVPTRVSLKMMKLNELEGMYDMMQLAEDRQREIFEEMTATGRYIEPEELQDHENMLAYALQYVMTTEYKYLEEDLKVLIKQHIKDRAALAGQEAGAAAPSQQMAGADTAGAIPGGPGTPGPAPEPGPLPDEETPI